VTGSSCATCSPRDISSCRSPPVQTSSTTSLTLQPRPWAASLTAVRSRQRNRTARPALTGRLSEVRGARAGLRIRRAMPALMRNCRAWLIGWARPAATRAIPRILVERPSASRLVPVAKGSGSHVAEPCSLSPWPSSNSDAIRATAARPSATAWCSFSRAPTRPSVRPVRNHSSHSGRLRSSTLPHSSAALSSSSPSPPGGSTFASRTCCWRSKPASSTHSGLPRKGQGTAPVA
jgi:hypothetical protein